MNPVDLLFLSQEDVAATGLTMPEVIGIVEEVFEAHGRKQYENPPKPGVHPKEDAYIHAMPAYLKAQAVAGMKWISGYSSNAQKGLPTIMGVIILNDVETEKPLAVMDAGLITAMRTAAVSAVSAKYLARPKASTLGLVGTGVQGRYHLSAFRQVMPDLREAVVYDIHAPTLEAFIREFREVLPVGVRAARSAEEVTRKSDVVVTATGQLNGTVYWVDWLTQGVLVLPVHMFGWQREILFDVDKFIVDDWAQFRHYMNRHGNAYLPLPDPHAELGEVVIAAKEGRNDADERIVNFNLGIALHDVAIGSRVLRRARERRLGRNLTLMSGPLPHAI